MITVILISIFAVSLCILLLGVRIFFTKEGKFPDTHISRNKAMKDRGIHCAQSQDREEQNKKNIFNLSNVE